jgi:hypothetical protein
MGSPYARHGNDCAAQTNTAMTVAVSLPSDPWRIFGMVDSSVLREVQP